jgi:hypothetical protein
MYRRIRPLARNSAARSTNSTAAPNEARPYAAYAGTSKSSEITRASTTRRTARAAPLVRRSVALRAAFQSGVAFALYLPEYSAPKWLRVAHGFLVTMSCALISWDLYGGGPRRGLSAQDAINRAAGREQPEKPRIDKLSIVYDYTRRPWAVTAGVARTRGVEEERP